MSSTSISYLIFPCADGTYKILPEQRMMQNDPKTTSYKINQLEVIPIQLSTDIFISNQHQSEPKDY